MVVESVSGPRLPQPRRGRGRARTRAQPALGPQRRREDEPARGHLHGARRALLPDPRRPRDDRLRRVPGARRGDGRVRRVPPPLPQLREPLPRAGATSSTASPPAPSADSLRPALAVFMPDRLALVKGPPGRPARAPRRLLRGALARPRGGPPPLLARARAAQRAARPDPRRRGRPPPPSTPGTSSSATAGVELIAIRAEAVERLAPAFERAGAGARPRAGGLAALPPAQRRDRGGGSSPPRSSSAATPTSPAATPAGDRITTSSPSSSTAVRCVATARRASSAPRCWRCCSPSAERCSTTGARRR